MNIGQIQSRRKPVLLKYAVKDFPHLTIETNLNCNIKCRNCYNINNTYSKSFRQISEEIDLGLRKRNLKTITIIGGEPTLHPDLVGIIKYIKGKNLICQMLTNGVIFLEDKKDNLLDAVIEAGLDKILLHVDEGQTGVHKNLSLVIDSLFEKFEKRKIFYALSTTIFHDTQQLVSEKIRKYSVNRYFDGILALLERDCSETIRPDYAGEEYGTMLLEYEGISGQLLVEPVVYIPTSLNDRDISWLFYFFFINAKTGQTFSRSTTFLGTFFGIYRFITGKYPFALNFRPGMVPLILIFSSIVELIINPTRLVNLYRLIAGSGFLSALRILTVVIQNPPEYHDARDQFHICYHCPDATIRNGLLTPLCLADLINPLPENDNNRAIPIDIRDTVYQHMEENT